MVALRSWWLIDTLQRDKLKNLQRRIMSFAKKILRYFLPLGLILLAIIVVIGMATMSRGKRPERQDSGKTAVLV